MTTDYALRRVDASDEAFLYRLFVSARPDAAILAALPDAQREPLLRMQFALQWQHYETHFPGSEHDIVLVRGERAGRSWVDWSRAPVCWLDVSLLPEHREKELGAALLRDLQAQARTRGVAVTLHVEHNNPLAKRFYARHGFTVVRDIGTHDLMRWDPERPSEPT